MPAVITSERPDASFARELIAELDDHLGSRYAACSRHGFSVDRLLRDNVAFFVIWPDESRTRAAGCGGVLLVNGAEPFAEIKRMYIRPEFRARRLGRLMLEHLIEQGKSHGHRVLRLETGIHQQEARALYERTGFRPIGPFPPYQPDPMSVFYELHLELNAAAPVRESSRSTP
jgi:putative acetyltransferase